MLLRLSGPFGEYEECSLSTRGLCLETLLADKIDLVESAVINGRFELDWKKFIPRKHDRINLILKTGEPISLTTLISYLVQAVVTAVISAALSFAVRALTPQPKQPKMDGSGQSYGLAGFQNTTGQGVPIPVWYGINRVHPHVIASGITVSPDGKNMIGRVLYCIGDAGGDGYQSLNDVRINDISTTQYPTIGLNFQLGADNQGVPNQVIPEFENVDNLWFVNQQIPWDDNTGGSPIFYTTKSNQINRVTVIFGFPSGLFRVNASGKTRPEIVSMYIYYRDWAIAATNPALGWTLQMPGPFEWVGDPNSYHFEGLEHTAFYPKIIINFPYPSQWQLQFYINGSHPFPKDEAHVAGVSLYNIQETVFTTTTYPGYVIMGITGIPAQQIQSLQSMDVSVRVVGKQVKIPDGGGGYRLATTRQRCWNVRDMMTHPVVGMGYEFDESEIDDAQWLLESQNYYDEIVTLTDQATNTVIGSEARDYSDFGVTQRRWDWDWIKRVVSEGRGRIFPANQRWKYVVDKPGSPMLLYAEPGNIIEDSIKMEFGPPEDDPYNQIIAEFRDENDNYNPGITEPITADDPPPPSIIQKALSYETITRQTQAIRENRIIIKRQFEERRRWTFISPMTALVGEPMDIDWLSERVIGGIGAATGTVGAGSTINQVILNQTVTLDPGKTYLLIIQRKTAALTTETRIVSNVAGQWAALGVTSPFISPPNEGDIYAVGEQNIDHVMTRAQDFNIDNDGRITQLRTEYIPDVYTDSRIPSLKIRRSFALLNLPPLPLYHATVVEEVVANRDGSYRSVILFDVTPGLPRIGGMTAGGTWANPSAVVLNDLIPGYPTPVNWWKNAKYKPMQGPDAGLVRNIISYGGNTAFFDAPFPNFRLPNELFEIYWDRYGDFGGFKVWESQDAIAWSQPTLHYGTHWEKDGGDQTGQWYFRFTPFSHNLVDNDIADQIRVITLKGDTSPPAPPDNVFTTSQYKNVTVNVFKLRPMAEDLGSINVMLATNPVDPFGSAVFAGRFGVTKDAGTTGYFNVRETITLSEQPYGAIIYGWAQFMDFSGNLSPWVGGGGTILQQVATPDIGAGSIGTIHFNSYDASVGLGSSPTLVLPGVSITTIGGSIDVQAKVTNTDTDPAAGHYVLGRQNDAPGTGTGNLTVLDQISGSGVMIGAETLPPGTWLYELYGFYTTPSTGGASASYIRLKVQENRAGY